MCLARGRSEKGSSLTEAPSAKHFLNIYNVPDLRLGSGIQRGTNASSLECPSPLPSLPLSLYTSKFCLLLITQLRCQGPHDSSVLPLQRITSFASKHTGLHLLNN